MAAVLEDRRPVRVLAVPGGSGAQAGSPGWGCGSAAMRRYLSARLVWLAAAGLLAGVAVAWVVSMAGPARASVPNVPLAVPVTVLVGWSLIGSGLLAWRPGPGNRIGPALVFTGF